ncbi:MAG: Electron transfer flavoprotein alpha/beta-subunit [Cyanobacteria bacterium RYN_339]|nr:Electron transfer flavoprotein alpha/beta-subunit [Cyanobacteria bacterium RYN_339]
MSNLNGIWVVGEHHNGALEPITYELLGKARELGQPVSVLLVGNGVKALAAGLGDYGADKVLVADHPDFAAYGTDAYGSWYGKTIEQHQPAVVLFGATSQGRDISSLASAYLHTGVLNDANALRLEGGVVKATRPIFGGNALTTLAGDAAKPQLVTVLPKAFEKATAGAGKAGEVVELAVDGAAAAKSLIKGFLAEVASGKINLSEAEIVVAGGRGVGSSEKFGIIEDLAKALGAAVGASRAVTDAGWRPANEQIGQTGVTIKPKLYIAAGISGAVQHWVGMKESGYIIAINTDADAPIMKAADLAIVGDLFKVIPEMIKEINAAKGVAV